MDTAAGWTADTTSPSGWKARHKGAARMRHSSAVVENLRFRLDERAGCQGGSLSPNLLIVPGPPGHGGRPLGGLSCFWASVFLLRAPFATPRTAFPSDPEIGPLVNPTYAGKLKVSVPILIGEFSLAQLAHRVLKRCSAPSTCADARGL